MMLSEPCQISHDNVSVFRLVRNRCGGLKCIFYIVTMRPLLSLQRSIDSIYLEFTPVLTVSCSASSSSWRFAGAGSTRCSHGDSDLFQPHHRRQDAVGKREPDSPQGRIAVYFLIVQDLTVVVAMTTMSRLGDIGKRYHDV